MNPDDVELMNTTQQFEYEKMSREIDTCYDVDQLQEMCKFLVKLEMKTRENYSVMIQDLMSPKEYPYSDILESYNNSSDEFTEDVVIE
jgi:DNA recombination-dependent growth factor C